MQGFEAYDLVRNLAKAAKLSALKVGELLHSKSSYTKFTKTTPKSKRIRAFAVIENEILCMDLAYVDKLAKDNTGEKYLGVRQELFDRTIGAMGMKTKASKQTVKTFSKMSTKRIDQRNRGRSWK